MRLLAHGKMNAMLYVRYVPMYSHLNQEREKKVVLTVNVPGGRKNGHSHKARRKCWEKK